MTCFNEHISTFFQRIHFLGPGPDSRATGTPAGSANGAHHSRSLSALTRVARRRGVWSAAAHPFSASVLWDA
jgi:hypothetical protein